MGGRGRGRVLTCPSSVARVGEGGGEGRKRGPPRSSRSRGDPGREGGEEGKGGGKRSRRREPGAPVRARSRSLAAGGGDSPPLRPGSPAGTSGPSSPALRLAPLPAGARVRRGEAPRPIRGRGEEPGGPLLGGAAHRANMVAAAAARGSPRSGPFGEICQSPPAFPLLDAFQVCDFSSELFRLPWERCGEITLQPHSGGCPGLVCVMGLSQAGTSRWSQCQRSASRV